jgi:lactoylglutathione lyase
MEPQRSISMKLTGVTPNLIVSDMDRSTAFYRDVLGFSVVTTVPEQAPFVFVWLERDGIKVFLNAAAGVKDDVPELGTRAIGGTNTLYMILEADSVAQGIDALFRAVDGKARVVMPLKDQFYGMREFGITDPDGYVIFFAQRIG